MSVNVCVSVYIRANLCVYVCMCACWYVRACGGDIIYHEITMSKQVCAILSVSNINYN